MNIGTNCWVSFKFAEKIEEWKSSTTNGNIIVCKRINLMQKHKIIVIPALLVLIRSGTSSLEYNQWQS